MKKENKKLGMGLGALLSPAKTNKSNVNKIDISKISPNKQQPRKNFEDKDIQELSNSIKNQATPSQIKKVADFYEKLYEEKSINIS